jgi:hypothetical protein
VHHFVGSLLIYIRILATVNNMNQFLLEVIHFIYYFSFIDGLYYFKLCIFIFKIFFSNLIGHNSCQVVLEIMI